MKRIGIVLFLLTCLINTRAQVPFQVSLEPVVVEDLYGVQSYAWAQYEDKLLIVGGRLDGLHRRQPWASFDIPGHNTNLILVDVESNEVIYRNMDELSPSLKEQLSSSNMAFEQVGNSLILIGGYGYSETAGDHITFPNMTRVNLPGLVQAMENDTSIEPHFTQAEEEQFAVCGGHLDYLNDVYYISGGQRFDGRYNPMNNPTFTQQYTNAVRRFTLLEESDEIIYTLLEPFVSEELMHRRDFNVCPQVLGDGSLGLTAYSGVFRTDIDLPYLNAVDITEEGMTEIPEFQQLYNHYHCAHTALFDSENSNMYTVFFGGIAQYYRENGELVQDNDVPFVKTIACIVRDSEGNINEYVLPVEMPDYLGASAEFIINPNLEQLGQGIIELGGLFTGEPVEIGYVLGGIQSPDKNIFWIEDGTISSANTVLYKVILEADEENTVLTLPKKPEEWLLAYPIDDWNYLRVEFSLNNSDSAEFALHTIQGQELHRTNADNRVWAPGKNYIDIPIDPEGDYPVVIINMRSGTKSFSQKVKLY